MMHRSLLRSGSSVASRAAPRVSPSAGVRHFRNTAPTKWTENKQLTGFAGLLEADNATFTTKLYHLTSVGLMGLVPVAFVLSPSPLNLPVDLALGVLIPLHAHVGMNNVISDYVPKAQRQFARVTMLGLTAVMLLGFVRVNLEGAGITETVKTVWREPPTKEAQQ